VPAEESYVSYEPTEIGGWENGYTFGENISYIEEPSVTLYSFDECTSTYYPIEEPTYTEQHYYFSAETSTYVPYVPSPAVWTDYYEPSTVTLYTYVEESGSYVEESTPSPYQQYYYYQAPTDTYISYTPASVQWTSYYEPSSESLFYYDQQTGTYSPE
jgi:hypothetical protein